MINYFVTAIGTDSGKTLAAAVLCEAFQADYWKPIQAGNPGDPETVQGLITNSKTKIHPSRYRLKTAESPHAAAVREGISLSLQDIVVPTSKNRMIIEGAGGILAPINDHHFMIDLATKLAVPVVVVADLYLGSINHTLLTAEALKNRAVNVRGLIFNGDPNSESQRIILKHTQWPVILHIGSEPNINKTTVSRYAEQLRASDYGGLDYTRPATHLAPLYPVKRGGSGSYHVGRGSILVRCRRLENNRRGFFLVGKPSWPRTSIHRQSHC
jgi:dethiobiotin synthetase